MRSFRKAPLKRQKNQDMNNRITKILVLCLVTIFGSSLIGCKQNTEQTYQKLYKEAVEEFSNNRKATETDYCKLCYDLIYFDDDDIPELVMGLSSYYVYMYTVVDNQMVPIINNWPYGAGGNGGYEYLERQGIVYNRNYDMAGAEAYDTYWKWDQNDRELHDINGDEYLFMRFYQDINGDGRYDIMDLNSGGETKDPLFFFGEDEITEEEYLAHTVPGEYRLIHGEMTYDDIMKALH